MTAKTLSPLAVFGLACGGAMLVSLDATLAVPVFPALRDAFEGSTLQQLSWVLNAYTIVYAALLAPSGRLSDIYGARRVFLVGGVIFTIASALCGIAVDAITLSLARAIQAMGGALMTPAALSLVLASFPPAKRAAMVGAISAAGALAAAMGPAIGAALVELGGWRLALVANVPFGACVVWLAWRSPYPTAPKSQNGATDIKGVLLLIAGMGLMTGAVVHAEAGRAAAPDMTLFGILGVAAILAYIRHAKGHKDAAIDLRLFELPDYTRASLATFVFGISFGMLFLHNFLFLIEIWAFAPAQAGLAVIPGPLAAIVAILLVGRWLPQMLQRHKAIVGATGLATTQAFLAATVPAEPAYWTFLFPVQVVSGLCVGLVFPSLTALSVAHLPQTRFGVGGAVNTAVRQFGAVIGTAIAIVLLGAAGTPFDAFLTSWFVMACFSFCVAAITLQLERKKLQTRAP